MTVSLDEVLDDLVAEAGGIDVKSGEYSRSGRVFAARTTDGAIELKLGEEIVEAALRTPDSSASTRGDDWVVLKTADWSHTQDRLEAWFRVAWRLAGKSPQK